MLLRSSNSAVCIGTVGRSLRASLCGCAAFFASSDLAARTPAEPELPPTASAGAIIANDGGWDDMCRPVDAGAEPGSDLVSESGALDPQLELFAFLGSDDDLAPRPRLAPIRDAAQDGKRVGDRREALPRFGRGPGDRPRPSDVPIEKLIEVARDINPNWATSITERLEQDREGTVRAMAQSGRRLLSLVALRDKDPALYDAKIRELRLQLELRESAIAYHDAKASNRSDDVERARAKIADLSRKAIDADRRSRSLELLAMERLLAEFVARLRNDSQPAKLESDASELAERLMQTQPGPGITELLNADARPRRGGDAAPGTQQPTTAPVAPRP